MADKKAKPDHSIDYVELPTRDVPACKQFYSAAFGWKYQDWGPEYADTQSSVLASGLNGSNEGRPPAPLVVLYAAKLEAARDAVTKAGGKIVREIFSFPGGRRFHFTDPAGNELAVWGE